MTRCLTTAALVLCTSVAFAQNRNDQNQNRNQGQNVNVTVDDLVRSMTPPADSKQFAMIAAECGLLEVRLAELAQQKAQSQEVKQLAQKIQQDHQRANDQLKQVAQSKQIDLPQELKGKKQAEYQAFQQLDGKVFENNYLLHMVKAHLHDIMMFQNESQNGSDQQIKQWAAQTLPHLRQHANQITQVAQTSGIPIEALARGMGTDTARPAGSRIGGSSADHSEHQNRSGTGTGTGTGTTPRTGTGGTSGGTSGTGGTGTGTGTGGTSGGTSGSGQDRNR